MEREPKRIILDMDVTDDATHGSQDGSAFNGYYQHECSTPLLIFCGRHVLSAKLRPANVDPAAGAVSVALSASSPTMATDPVAILWSRP